MVEGRHHGARELGGAGRPGERTRPLVPGRRDPGPVPARGATGAGLCPGAGWDRPRIKGFMIGRSVWAGPALQWLRNELDDAALRDAVAANFRALIAGWDASRVDARQDITEGAAA